MEHNLEEEIREQQSRGILLVITGPSGSGKDTLIHRLLEKQPRIRKVITTTTRAPREGESEGNPYHFLERHVFEQKMADGNFFEWVEFRGELYGTQKGDIVPYLSQGQDLIWKIEAKGVKNMKEKIHHMVKRSVFVFLTAPEIDVMKKRVQIAEGEQMDVRWNEPLVIWEMKQYADSDYLIVNRDQQLETAVEQLEALLIAKRCEIHV